MKEPTMTSPRTIDHLVLPVLKLDIAHARYAALGFNVAPDGQHPFGTENCCIFFADGTFLEPIAIAHRETCEAAALAGNTFVRNDQTYRFRRGFEGFSHVVLKSEDADRDHAEYRAAGVSGGEMVHFSRAFQAPGGEVGEVSFALAFAADQRAPDAGFFTCQVVNAPAVDRSALHAHVNTALGVREIVACEANPTDFQYFLQDFLDQREVGSDSFGMTLRARNTDVTVLTPDGLNARFGIPDGERFERGLRLRGFTLAVASLAATRDVLTQGGIAFHERLGAVIVPPETGQAAFIAFREEAA